MRQPSQEEEVILASEHEVQDGPLQDGPLQDGPGCCQDLYEINQNSKSLLLAMCCGVLNGKWQIRELDVEPYLSLLKNVKLKFKVGKEDYIKEVG